MYLDILLKKVQYINNQNALVNIFVRGLDGSELTMKQHINKIFRNTGTRESNTGKIIEGSTAYYTNDYINTIKKGLKQINNQNILNEDLFKPVLQELEIAASTMKKIANATQ